MEWVFSAFLIASIIHMVEEYVYPGGFIEVMRSASRKFAPYVTTPMVVIMNGLQLVLCILAMAVGRKALPLSMSVAGLLVINGVIHLLACIRAQGYAPGAISGALIYLPLAGWAYYQFIRAEQLTLSGVIISGVLGLGYQAAPIGYLALARARRER